MRKRPNARIRRVRFIAHLTATLTHNERLYMTAINAEPCPDCGLVRGRHRSGCLADNGGDHGCPF